MDVEPLIQPVVYADSLAGSLAVRALEPTATNALRVVRTIEHLRSTWIAPWLIRAAELALDEEPYDYDAICGSEVVEVMLEYELAPLAPHFEREPTDEALARVLGQAFELEHIDAVTRRDVYRCWRAEQAEGSVLRWSGWLKRAGLSKPVAQEIVRALDATLAMPMTESLECALTYTRGVLATEP